MAEQLSEDALAILASIRDHPGIQAKHVALEFQMDWTRVHSAVKELQDKGLIAAKTSYPEKVLVVRFYAKI
jgi:DNA-binding MarR family transcriptional regulator